MEHFCYNNLFFISRTLKKNLILLFILLAQQYYSQSLTYRAYTVNDGLPSSRSFDIIQDSHKYIWIATDKGVSRFDGYIFKNFTIEDGLLDNAVFKIYEDKTGRIWFLSKLGKLTYYLDGKIHPYKYNHLIERGLNTLFDPIRSFYVTDDGSVVIGSVLGGIIEVSKNGKVKQVPLQTAPNYNTSLLSFYKNQYHWGGMRNLNLPKSQNRIMFFNGTKKVLEKKAKRNPNRNQYFLKRKNQHLIYASSAELVDIYNNKISDSLSALGNVISLYEDSDSCLWVGFLEGGVLRFSPNRTFTHPVKKEYFPHIKITSVLEDSEHGFWFTTLYNGVIYVPNVNIENFDLGSNSEIEQAVALCTDFKTKVFVGTTKGNVIFFVGGKKKGSLNFHTNTTMPTIRNLYYDSKLNQLYIQNPTETYILKKNKITPRPDIPGIISFQRDNKGTLYGGSYNDIIKGFPSNIINIENKTERIRPDAMCVDQNNTLWAGTTKGLYYVEGSNIKKYEKEPLFNTHITSLAYTKNAMYIGTLGNGIIKWQGKTIENFKKEYGFSSNIINAMQLQNDSILWVATPLEVCKLNINQKKIIYSLNSNKGIGSNDIRNIKILNDTVYLLSFNGVSFFNSNKTFKNNTPPVIYIESFKVDTANYTFQKDPELTYDHNYLTFNVRGLSYKQFGKIKYHYRLVGSSENWQSTMSNSIQFAFVTPGSYSFEVVAENEDGILSEHPAIFKFVINDPLWSKLWFQLLCILIVIIISGLAFYLRLKSIKEKNKMLSQLEGFKQQALVMQMNPHFIFNSLTSIQSYVLSEKPLKASKYLAMFSKLMRMSLNNSRKEFISLKEEIDLLYLYLELESLRTKNIFSFDIIYDEQHLNSVLIPPMLIQPHIENAIKHGLKNSDINKQGIIETSFFLQNHLLYCKVEDNGIGINKAFELKKLQAPLHKSSGIDLTKIRLELLCNTLGFPFSFIIKDRSELAANTTGTIVEFLIPYKNEIKSTDS